MRALTIWQPWASLLVCGVKHNETRSWATNHRGPLAIHAAKFSYRDLRKAVGDDELMRLEDVCERAGLPPIATLPRGAVVGTVNLDRVMRMSWEQGHGLSSTTVLRPIRGRWCGENVSAEEMALGDYDTDRGNIKRFAWCCTEPHMLEGPLQCPGSQGLWNLSDWAVRMLGIWGDR